MFGKISLWAAGAVVAGLMLPSQAMAQYDAHTRADLNLRVGPGLEYGVIDVIPAGYPVDVLGCLDAYEWCDIIWDGLRGWVSARYLVQPGTMVYLPQYAPRIGVPIITFSFFSYHDRYYRDRPWYRERYGRWTDRDWREHDRDRDRDQAEERQEAERPRRQREVQPQQQRQREVQPQQPQQQRQREVQPQPRRQREVQPQQQLQREAQPQQQQRQARPQQGEQTQQQGQRRRSSGEDEELLRQRQRRQ